MNQKEELIQKLEEKLRIKKNEFIDSQFKRLGVPYDNGETEYNNIQRFLNGHLVDESRMPLKTKILSNVLKTINQSNPTILSNANNNQSFSVYHFLKKLQEPATKYFKEAEVGFSVVEHLAIKHDENFPCKENGFDWEVYYEGADIYLSLKKGTVEDLELSFVKRGPVQKYNETFNIEQLSKIITPSRYIYLSELAKDFEEHPESEEIIEFVKHLPNNTWFDSSIHLICDDLDEFEKYHKEYIPDYKPFKIS